MTVVDDRITDDGTDDRIEMAEHRNSEHTLDALFKWLEKTAPDGYRIDIVEGGIFMTPQRSIHWDIIADIFEQLRTKFPRKRILSDVRIDYPGHLNGFCSDITLVSEASVEHGARRFVHNDVEFVAEVVSKGTGHNDYHPKRIAYATAEIPVYLIADPYQGKCHVYTQPKKGDYVSELRVPFGNDLDLTGTVLGLTISTDEFPRE
ncbi:Uma2 family endonuclease [Streptomyces sp. NBC_01431]|jgi:Uma2 family endonuclease|uniref:Uma2 family endonuclease n=1 Tax=Streptomyces sp. NBC_01431 TaxID=2903863 RepID=UPI002E311101|nr:Uma2 family endonuclease [Streptomyces sp. NBC_01431]